MKLRLGNTSRTRYRRPNLLRASATHCSSTVLSGNCRSPQSHPRTTSTTPCHSWIVPAFFRLNIGVSKQTFESLFGTTPADISRYDYTALGRFMPHPDYAAWHFICIL